MACAQGTPFDTPEGVLRGASQLAVAELVAEPRVREFVRGLFQETAVVSTGAQPYPPCCCTRNIHFFMPPASRLWPRQQYKGRPSMPLFSWQGDWDSCQGKGRCCQELQACIKTNHDSRPVPRGH